jgi:hypothetical protein
MQTNPDQEDFDVIIVAYADGHDPNIIRTVHNSIVPLAYDCVLLHSQRSLGIKSFPIPARSHYPPHNDAATTFPIDIALLCYNGNPSPVIMRDRYPNTKASDLYAAITDLWIDRLSYSTGKTTVARFDRDAIFHQISCLAGASGGPILDSKGKIIGISCAITEYSNW